MSYFYLFFNPKKYFLEMNSSKNNFLSLLIIYLFVIIISSFFYAPVRFELIKLSDMFLKMTIEERELFLKTSKITNYAN
jgi:hypothetical protein